MNSNLVLQSSIARIIIFFGFNHWFSLNKTKQFLSIITQFWTSTYYKQTIRTLPPPIYIKNPNLPNWLNPNNLFAPLPNIAFWSPSFSRVPPSSVALLQWVGVLVCAFRRPGFEQEWWDGGSHKRAVSGDSETP